MKEKDIIQNTKTKNNNVVKIAIIIFSIIILGILVLFFNIYIKSKENDNSINEKPVLANEELNTISINVFLDNEGVAHISELWYFELKEDTKYTELYKTFPKITNITNLSVKEGDKLYTTLDSWDTQGSLELKKDKAGINKNGDFIEICWGIGEYGTHKYEVSYDITNFLTELNDSQIMVGQLVPQLFEKCENVNLKIYSDFSYKDIEVYTFGKSSSTKKIQSDYIEIETNGKMYEKEYLDVFIKFPLQTFNINNRSDDNFKNILAKYSNNDQYTISGQKQYKAKMTEGAFTLDYLIALNITHDKVTSVIRAVTVHTNTNLPISASSLYNEMEAYIDMALTANGYPATITIKSGYVEGYHQQKNININYKEYEKNISSDFILSIDNTYAD